MKSWSEATQVAVKEALEDLLLVAECGCDLRSDDSRIYDAKKALELIRQEETSEKPIHHITRNGCSVCGTDAMNCKLIKELRSTKREEAQMRQVLSEYFINKYKIPDISEEQEHE